MEEKMANCMGLSQQFRKVGYVPAFFSGDQIFALRRIP